MKLTKKTMILNNIMETCPSVENDLETLKLHQEKQSTYDKLQWKYNRYKNILDDTSKVILKMLQNDGFLLENSLEKTTKGFIASHLKEIHCLVIGQLWDDLKELSVEDLLIYLSCYTNIRVPVDNKRHSPNVLTHLFQSTEKLFDTYYSFEVEHNFDSGESYEIHFDLIDYIESWIRVDHTEDAIKVLNIMKHEKQIQPGDFVKAIMKMNNIVEQFIYICESTNDLHFLSVLKKIPDMTLKFIATNQSLYV
jgi:hypothetical protein